MSISKKEKRLRRATRTRCKIRELGVTRLCVHKTLCHMYAQLTSADGSKTLATASTLDKELRKKLSQTGNVDAAKEVGRLVAERALKVGIEKVAFDRGGFNYHGRVKALADGAREAGLKF